MVYILIDGYNLIGIAHKNLQKARNDLVDKLSEYSKIKGHDITIVFDGWKDGQANETKLKIGNINIIYSRIGEKADFVIKKILNGASRRQWIVVSSDREISDYAERKNFVSVTSSEFEARLYSFINNTIQGETEESSEYENEEVDESFGRQKGNPRQLSKRLKRKIRALEKL